MRHTDGEAMPDLHLSGGFRATVVHDVGVAVELKRRGSAAEGKV